MRAARSIWHSACWPRSCNARQTGRGQVVDAAIVDGTASLATTFFGMHAAGMLQPKRGSNITDSGSHFYDVYECADGGWLAVGPIEAKFYAEFLRMLGVDPAALGAQNDRASWPRAKASHRREVPRAAARSTGRSCSQPTDACVAPVLDWDEAPRHEHLAARGTFIEVDGIVQPAPAPRFSATPPATPAPPAPVTPENTRAALAQWLSRGRGRRPGRRAA